MSRFRSSPLGGVWCASGVAAVVLAALCGAGPRSTHAATLALQPVADAALYEVSATTTANGAGEVLMAGRTNQATGSRRRSLLSFDLTSLPAGAVISSVSLRLFLFTVTTAETGLSLHRVTTPWTEGPSDPAGNESNGTAAVVGDATWNFASFDTSAWTTSGGDALAAPSATLSVGTTSGFYTWSSAGLTSDTAAWATDPAQNFGWLLRGDEFAPQTAKRFASSENPDPSIQPVLFIEFEPIPEPGAGALLVGGLAMLLRRRRHGGSLHGQNLRQITMVTGSGALRTLWPKPATRPGTNHCSVFWERNVLVQSSLRPPLPVMTCLTCRAKIRRATPGDRLTCSLALRPESAAPPRRRRRSAGSCGLGTCT